MAQGTTDASVNSAKNRIRTIISSNYGWVVRVRVMLWNFVATQVSMTRTAQPQHQSSKQ